MFAALCCCQRMFTDWTEISLIHTLEHFVSTLIILRLLRSTDIDHLTLVNFTSTAVVNHFNA